MSIHKKFTGNNSIIKITAAELINSAVYVASAVGAEAYVGTIRKQCPYPVIILGNTNLEYGDRWKSEVEKLVPGISVKKYLTTPATKDGRRKTQYQWQVIRRKDVLALLTAIRPHLSHTKSEAVDSILTTFGGPEKPSRVERYLCYWTCRHVNHTGTIEPAQPEWSYKKPPTDDELNKL
jgi:hypothetical protein